MVMDNSISSSFLLILVMSYVMVVVHGSSPSDDSDSEDNELQVMLKKITGICLVIQLRSIQLYEADFNFYNRYVYRQEVMKALMDGGFLK